VIYNVIIFISEKSVHGNKLIIAWETNIILLHPDVCNTILTLQLYGQENLDEISAKFGGIEPYRAREDSFQRTLRTLELIAVRT